jgi:hypothetical protein
MRDITRIYWGYIPIEPLSHVQNHGGKKDLADAKPWCAEAARKLPGTVSIPLAPSEEQDLLDTAQLLNVVFCPRIGYR